MSGGPKIAGVCVVTAILAALNARANIACGAAPVGVVSHVKVVSDKVRDVSSMEAWKRSYLRDDMTDAEKAVAVWRTVVAFRHQEPPPKEFRHEECVHDPIKTFNVYGYGMCCCASSNIEALARYAGLDARGLGIHSHSVPEIYYDGAWHMFDASLVNYFPKPDGKIASVDEIAAATKAWYARHPDCLGNDGKLGQFQRANGWTGWRDGPELLAKCPFFDGGGWLPARTHGWASTMHEYDGAGGTPFTYECGYSQGYEVNVQLRAGERLVRRWSNDGLHVNGILGDGGTPGCLKEKMGEGSLAYQRQYGDITSGRIGSGTLEYDVPLAGGAFRAGSLKADNLAAKSEDGAGPAVHVRDAASPAVLEIGMNTSYVFLGGKLSIDAAVGRGGAVRVRLSDNNGLDWKDVAAIDREGLREFDLQKFVLRRYDYRLRFELSGKGTGLDRLKISHPVQCSQRALPTLDKGDNTIAFSAGPDEGTVTVEGTSYGNTQGKNVSLADYHPVLRGLTAQQLCVQGSPADATFTVATPGDMTRLRLGGFFRARDKRDQWQTQVSFDGGRSFRTVATMTGPTQGKCQYTTVSDVPAGVREAQVRFSGQQRNATCLFLARIDADYRQPHGGFRPVKVTYVWEENGDEKRDVHIARSPRETYKIACASKPAMKRIELELAE